MDPQNFAIARRNMVDCQIKPNRVTEPRLLAAMGAVPREAFVPSNLRGVAYLDEALPVAQGRYLITPMVLARLLQEAEIQPTDVVLHVGCGTGYGAAIASRLAATVVGLESDAALAETAAETLAAQGCDSVVVEQGPLAEGCAKHAPYDVIVVEGEIDFLPDALANQLAEGGRLVAVLRENGVGEATIWVKRNGRIGRRALFDAAAPLLPGFERVPGFVF
jgi:protein-L-isoaspartate(D-aspartate) O-methyltransferase